MFLSHLSLALVILTLFFKITKIPDTAVFYHSHCWSTCSYRDGKHSCGLVQWSVRCREDGDYTAGLSLHLRGADPNAKVQRDMQTNAILIPAEEASQLLVAPLHMAVYHNQAKLLGKPVKQHFAFCKISHVTTEQVEGQQFFLAENLQHSTTKQRKTDTQSSLVPAFSLPKWKCSFLR